MKKKRQLVPKRNLRDSLESTTMCNDSSMTVLNATRQVAPGKIGHSVTAKLSFLGWEKEGWQKGGALATPQGDVCANEKHSSSLYGLSCSLCAAIHVKHLWV